MITKKGNNNYELCVESNNLVILGDIVIYDDIYFIDILELNLETFQSCKYTIYKNNKWNILSNNDTHINLIKDELINFNDGLK